MPKFVVLLKNSTLLALLGSLFFVHFPIKSGHPEPSGLLKNGFCCLVASKICNDNGGFVGDTLVKTVAGYEKISDLTVGAKLITLDEATGCFCEQPVTNIATVLVTKTLSLTLDNEKSTTICTGSKQTFYGYNAQAEGLALQKNFWLESSVLKGSRVFSGDGMLPVYDVQQSSKLRKLYLIEVAETHNFFVTHSDVLVHNNPFALPAIAEISAEAAMLVAAGAKLVVDAVTGNNQSGNLNNDNGPTEPQNITPPIDANTRTTSGGGSPGGPDKPPKKDDGKKPKCTKECDNKTCKKIEDTKNQQVESEKSRADSEKIRADQANEYAKQHRADKLEADKKLAAAEQEKIRLENQAKAAEVRIAAIERKNTKFNQMITVIREVGLFCKRSGKMWIGFGTFAFSGVAVSNMVKGWLDKSKDERIAISEKATREALAAFEQEKQARLAEKARADKLEEEAKNIKKKTAQVDTQRKDLWDRSQGR